MGLHPQRREMVDVELVEDGLPAQAVPDADQHLVDRPRFSRRLGLVASATALAVTFAVVTQEADPRGGSPLVGAAPSLISPLAEIWRIETPSGWSVAGDLLLTIDHGRQGPLVRAHDLADGEPRWALDLAPDVSGVACPIGVDGPDGPWVVCQVVGHVAQTHHLPDGARGDTGRLLLVSAADGSVQAELPLDDGHVGMGALEGDLVLADLTLADPQDGGPGADMTLHLERRDLATGGSVWVGDLPIAGYTPPAAVQVAVDHGMVLVTGRTTALLDGTDGRPVRTWLAGDEHEHPRGHVAVSPLGFGVRAALASWTSPTSWFAPDGALVGSFVGDLAEPEVTDGSEPEITLVATPGHSSLRGVDVAAGRGRWSVDLEGGQPVVRVGGAVVVSGSSTLRSIDLRSGVELWRSSADGLDNAQAVSDGSFVLATGRAPGVGRSIAAVSLDDGSLLWRAGLPGGARVLKVIDGRVVAVGPGVVIGLG